ncbi:putative glutamyl-tRNA amidotransferase subunit A [Usnea florida]
MTSSTWQDVVHQIQSHRDHTLTLIQPPIPELPTELPRNVTALPQTLLSPREAEITTTTTEDLVASLGTGRLTSTEVTNAFLRRAGLAQKLTNCVTELLSERALGRAKELDDYLTEHKKPRGPLHGLPISVKEHVGMKDLNVNAGLVSWVGTKAEEHALVLKILWQAGCVFYVRTTEPQTLMQLETSSNLYGVTVNPFDRFLTSGGSSGGEGSLIGLRGSCLGVGSDIGGSIRSPAANNGLYGLRPTSCRIPLIGCSAPQQGSGYIEPVVGPLSTSLNGIKLFMKTVLGAKPWVLDPSLVPLPWRDEQTYFMEKKKRKRIKIAVLWSDDVVKPHPPITRALKEVINKVREVPGVEVVDWKPYKHDFAWKLIASLYYMDGGDEATELIESSSEPWRPLTRFIVSENPHVKHRSIAEIQDLKTQRDNYRYEYTRHWNSTTTHVAENGDLEGVVDIILCPTSPGVALPLDSTRYWGYTSQWNLLDYPALVFPVTTVDISDVPDTEYSPINERDSFMHSLYDGPERFLGVPVSLQVVGRPYEDEKLVEALAIIASEIGLPFTNFS